MLKPAFRFPSVKGTQDLPLTSGPDTAEEPARKAKAPKPIVIDRYHFKRDIEGDLTAPSYDHLYPFFFLTSSRRRIYPLGKGINMKHHNMRRLGAALALTAALTGGVLAQETADLSDEQVKERLGFLENALISAQPRAKLWWYGWIAGFSTAAAVQGGLAVANWDKTGDDKDFAEDMLVGGATCAIGAAGQLIFPFVPAYGPKALPAMPEGTPEERQAKLVKTEELLRQCAKKEKEGRGWLTHGLNLGVNVTAGLVTVLAFDRPWSDGLVTFAVSESISLLNIFSQPTRARRDLKNYEIRFQGKPGVYREAGATPIWNFSIFPGGIHIGLKF